MVNYTQWRSLVDGSDVPDIPDSVVSRYDATEEGSTGEITTINDSQGDFDLSGSVSVISDGINGNQSYRFNGTDDLMENTGLDVSAEPFAVIIVFKQLVTESAGQHFDAANKFTDFSLQDNVDGFYRAFRGGSNIDADSSDAPDKDAHIAVVKADNTDEISVELDGSEILSGVADVGDLDGIVFGASGDETNYLEFDLGEAEVLEDATSSDIIDEADRLSDKWGISLA